MIKIDKTKEVTSRLPFIPFPQFNDLGLGYLTGVRVEETTSKEDAKWEFRGKTIPMLAFDFIQHKLKSDEKDRYMTVSFTPISNELADGTKREASKLETSYYQMWDKIKHLHDQYQSNENWKAIDAVPEFNPDGDLDTRLAEFKKFFTDIAKDFTIGKDGSNPVYKDKQLLAIVLVASGKKLNYHAIPDFVGKGIFELAKIVNGKLETTLLVPPNATTKLGASAPISITSNTAATDDDIPEELKKYMNQ